MAIIGEDFFVTVAAEVTAGVAVAAILAIVGALKLRKFLRRRTPLPRDRIRVVVASLEGDESKSIHKTIGEIISFQLQQSVAVITLEDIISLNHGLHERAEADAQRRAQSLLRVEDADVLIWGRLTSPNHLSLRFTPAEQKFSQPDFYTLTQESLELPSPLVSRLGIAIAAHATSTLNNTAALKPKIAPALQRLGDGLEKLLHSASAEFDHQTLATLYHSSARVRLQQYDLAGDSVQDLEASIRLNQKALELWDRSAQRKEWAKTQNNLGSCLSRLGERTGVFFYFDQAIAALEAAIAEQKIEGAPHIGTQFNLASVFMRRGQRALTNDDLTDAIAKFDQLISQELRYSNPEVYAGLQNNRGLALMLLGARESDLATLNMASEALNEALEIRQKDIAPYDWASIKINFGTTLVALGDRLGELPYYQSAIENIKESLSVITRDQNPGRWAVAQANLGTAQISMSSEFDEHLLNSAVSALNSALELIKRDDNPVAWVNGQINLGRARTQLGYLNSDKELLQLALPPLEAVLDEASVKSSHRRWTHAQNEYGTALLNLGELEPKYLDRAERILEKLSTELSPVTSPTEWLRATVSYGRANRLKGEHIREMSLLDTSIDTLLRCFTISSVETNRGQYCSIHFQLAKSYLARAEIGLIDNNTDKCREHCEKILEILSLDKSNRIIPKVKELIERADELDNSAEQ